MLRESRQVYVEARSACWQQAGVHSHHGRVRTKGDLNLKGKVTRYGDIWKVWLGGEKTREEPQEGGKKVKLNL